MYYFDANDRNTHMMSTIASISSDEAENRAAVTEIQEAC